MLEEPRLSVEDVDFCDTHMVLVLREGKRLRLSSVRLPLPMDVKVTFDFWFINFTGQIKAQTNHTYCLNVLYKILYGIDGNHWLYKSQLIMYKVLFFLGGISEMYCLHQM